MKADEGNVLVGEQGGFEPFTAEIESLLDRVAENCASRGVKLTDLRRQVLGLILEARAPLGAYELLDRLRARRAGAAPPTVYRALDFLGEQGLVHRLERLAAFVGCVEAETHDHAHKGCAHGPAQFLICRGCGKVVELEDEGLATALADAARRAGFTVTGATIEAEGLCPSCRAA